MFQNFVHFELVKATSQLGKFDRRITVLWSGARILQKIRRPSADLAPILDSSGGDPANLTRS